MIARGGRDHPTGGIGHYTDTHVSGGVRFVEGRDPDGIRVVIAHPSPKQRPRAILDSRFYN